MEKLPTNPPGTHFTQLLTHCCNNASFSDIVVATTPTGPGSYTYPEPEPQSPSSEGGQNRLSEVKIEVGECGSPISPIEPNSPTADDVEIVENKVSFFPSSPKDLDVLKNVRKAYVGRTEGMQKLQKLANFKTLFY